MARHRQHQPRHESGRRSRRLERDVLPSPVPAPPQGRYGQIGSRPSTADRVRTPLRRFTASLPNKPPTAFISPPAASVMRAPSRSSSSSRGPLAPPSVTGMPSRTWQCPRAYEPLPPDYKRFADLRAENRILSWSGDLDFAPGSSTASLGHQTMAQSPGVPPAERAQPF